MTARDLFLRTFGWQRVIPESLQFGLEPEGGGPPETQLLAILALDHTIHRFGKRMPPGLLHIHPVKTLLEAAGATGSKEEHVFEPVEPVRWRGGKTGILSFAYDGGAFGCILRLTDTRVLKIAAYATLDAWTIREALVLHIVQGFPLAPKLHGMYLIPTGGVMASHFDKGERDKRCPSFNSIFGRGSTNKWVIAFDMQDYPSAKPSGGSRWFLSHSHLTYFAKEMKRMELELDFVHGDLKNENVVWDAKTDRPVLLDFGVSSARGIANRYRHGIDPLGASHWEPYVFLFAGQAGWKLPQRRQDADVWALGVDILVNLIDVRDDVEKGRWGSIRPEGAFDQTWIPFDEGAWPSFVQDTMTAILFLVGYDEGQGGWSWKGKGEAEAMQRIGNWADSNLQDAKGSIWQSIVGEKRNASIPRDVIARIEEMQTAGDFVKAPAGLLGFVHTCLKMRQEDYLWGGGVGEDRESYWGRPLSFLLTKDSW